MEAVLWIVGVLVVMLGFPVMCNMRGDQQGVGSPYTFNRFHYLACLPGALVVGYVIYLAVVA